ncbi:MAG: hypothetical protein FGM55_09820 [Rhodoferax sp.]|nr:hypothetical protein [Rhodoferax sp.]
MAIHAPVPHAPISLRVHATLDGLLLGILFVSPWVFGYSQHQGATALAVGFSVLAMGLNFVTDYPLGLWRKLPMKWHRMAELTSPPVTIAVPWLFFRDAGAFPWVASVLGLAILVSTILTRPTPQPA